MAPIFYYSFPLESELASVLWIDLYCWPWVKECFLDLSLEDTFAFPCPLMSDGSQNRDTVVWFLMYLLLTMGDFRRLSADRKNKEGQTSNPSWSFSHSHGHGLHSYPGFSLLTVGVECKKVDKSASTSVITDIRAIQTLLPSKVSIFKSQWRAYNRALISVTLDGNSDLYRKDCDEWSCWRLLMNNCDQEEVAGKEMRTGPSLLAPSLNCYSLFHSV